MELCENKKCTGCTACVSICPVAAIDMEQDTFGFLYPKINKFKCINCGLCKQVCPVNKEKFNPAQKTCYAAINSNYSLRSISSSGSIFPLLADSILENKGYVCGAIIDHDLSVKHIVSNNHNDILMMQGTKYVQSDVQNVFPEIKNLLIAGKLLLFSGTPCQVSGLYHFLGKEFENLFTVDLICHGVPSPGLLQKYIQCLNSKNNITNISFRDKVYGWKSVRFVARINDEILVEERTGENPYLKSFQQKSILRECCYYCAYARIDRVSDITLGDFWGIEKLDIRSGDGLGTSLVICNSKKGRELFSTIKHNLMLLKKFPLKLAAQYNNNLLRPTKISHKRDTLKSLLINNSDINIENILTKINIPVGILNFHDANNYGAVLVPFALSKMLTNLGFVPEIINYSSKNKDKINLKFEEFRNKFLKLSPKGYGAQFLEKINRRYKIFITGSDQVFRMRDTKTYMLNWVHGYKTILSYAASFGKEFYDGNCSVPEATNLLNRFDAISVREESGINICRNTFNTAAVQLIDPVLAMESSDFDTIINSETCNIPEDDYVACVFLGRDRNRIINDNNILSELKLKYKFINVVRDQYGEFRSIPEYLSLIKNAKYVLTNSFHGTVLSIVFKKQFITVVNLSPTRQMSLLKSLDINLSHLCSSLNELSEKYLSDFIDYSKVDSHLYKLKKDAYNYLSHNLMKKPSHKARVCKNSKISLCLYDQTFSLDFLTNDQYEVILNKDLEIAKKDNKTGVITLFSSINLNGRSNFMLNKLFRFLENRNDVIDINKEIHSLGRSYKLPEFDLFHSLVEKNLFYECLIKLESHDRSTFTVEDCLLYNEILSLCATCLGDRKTAFSVLDSISINESVFFRYIYAFNYVCNHDILNSINHNYYKLITLFCNNNYKEAYKIIENIGISSNINRFLLLIYIRISREVGYTNFNFFRNYYSKEYGKDFFWSLESAYYALYKNRYKNALNHLKNAYNNDFRGVSSEISGLYNLCNNFIS